MEGDGFIGHPPASRAPWTLKLKKTRSIHEDSLIKCSNPWTGKGNPYTRQEVRDRLQATLEKGEAIIAAGAGTGISAKFIEKGGADLIII